MQAALQDSEQHTECAAVDAHAAGTPGITAPQQQQQTSHKGFPVPQYCRGSFQQAAGTSPTVQIFSFESDSCGSFEALGQEGLGAAGTWDAGDYSDEEQDAPAVEHLVVQLVSSQGPRTTRSLLSQLTHPSVPHHTIISCDAWLPLLQLLPHFLASSCPATAAAAEQLLLHQLAPELLGCSPEPLAQLLAALLAFSCNPSSCDAAAVASSTLCAGGDGNASSSGEATSNTSSTASTSGTRQTAAAAAGHQAQANYGSSAAAAVVGQPVAGCSSCQGQQQLPASVVQLLVVGLHKLARQWHFLDVELSRQLTSAIVDMLLQPLVQTQQPPPCVAAAALSRPLKRSAQQQQPQQERVEQQQVCLSEQQQRQQQGTGQQTDNALDEQLCPAPRSVFQTCCLAEQLLLADPLMGWWHRLNANSKSIITLRDIAASRGLCKQIMHYVECSSGLSAQQPSRCLATGREAAAVHAACAGADAAGAGLAEQPSSSKSSSNNNRISLTGNEGPGVQHQCLVAQLLSAFVSSPSGRRLLAAEQAQICDQVSRELPTTQQHATATAAAQQQPGGQRPTALAAAVDYLLCVASYNEGDCGVFGGAAVAAAKAAAKRAVSVLEQEQGVSSLLESIGQSCQCSLH